VQKKILVASVLALTLVFNFCNAQSTFYSFRNDPIDVVIPAANKDAFILTYCIKSIRKYVSNVRRIIVISKDYLAADAEWFDENSFPFSKADVAFYLNKEDSSLAQKYLNERPSRVGWYFQQLLKLYATFVIPNISSNILIVDADVIFLKPVNFLSGGNAGLYNIGTECHTPYFDHATKLIPNFTKIYPEYSGVCHHMLFQRAVIEDLFQTVEDYNHIEFWKAFCLHVNPGYLKTSGASEYEIYFNFVFSKTPQVEIRQLKWANKPPLESPDALPQLIYQARQEGLYYISCHNYKTAR
jgi:Family of unknown function (DUF6492)